jgi:hypothetical protein
MDLGDPAGAGAGFGCLKRRFVVNDRFKPTFLTKLDRTGLRRALWLLRRQDTHPAENDPAANQYFGLATASAVRAEYARRGWKLPKPSRAERAERGI